MKKLIVLSCVFLAACGGGNRPRPDVGPPPKQEIIIEKVPVPVLCKVSVTRPALDIESVPEGAPLEVQNSSLRSTIASASRVTVPVSR